MQERALRIVYDDDTSEYEELLEKFGTTTMLKSRLVSILLEVFKTIREKILLIFRL